MPNFDPGRYLTIEQYEAIRAAWSSVALNVALTLGRHAESLGVREVILRNAIARSERLVRSIFRLWRDGAYGDACILARALFDRVFHIVHLGKEDTFQLFENWSLFRQFAEANRVRSDSEFREYEKDGVLPEISAKTKARIKALEANPPRWKRPNPKVIADSLEMGFLHHYGYHLYSSHVHPMATDGEDDFRKILGAPAQHPAAISVVSNSLLIGVMISQEVLRYSNMVWRPALGEFFGALVHSIGTGDNAFHPLLIVLADPDIASDWGHPKAPEP